MVSRIILIGFLIVNVNIEGKCCCKSNSGDNGRDKTSFSGTPSNKTDKKINITINEKVGEEIKTIGTITIDQKTTIGNLKFEIFKISNTLLPGKQKLILNNNILGDNSKTLNECNINNGTVIMIEIEENEEDININLKTISGETVNINVKPSETILELKNVASWKFGGGHNINNIKLIYAGMQLDNSRTIKDYSIKNSKDKDLPTTIHVIFPSK